MGWFRFIVLMVACGAWRARGQPGAAPSALETVEWMVVDSDVVVAGPVVQAPEGREGLDGWRVAAVRAEQLIKADGERVLGGERGWVELLVPEGAPTPLGRRGLWCLKRAARVERAVGDGAKTWELVLPGRPGPQYGYFGYFSLEMGSSNSYDAAIELATRAAAEPEPSRVGVLVWPKAAVYRGSRAAALRMGGGYVIPADGRWRRHVRRQVERWEPLEWEVVGGSAVAMGTPPNVELMKRVMESRAFYAETNGGWPEKLEWYQTKHFFHRYKAFVTLREWGVDVAAPVEHEPMVIPRRVPVWWWLAGAAALGLCVAASRRVRRVGKVFSLVSGGVCVVAAVLWIRSGTRYEQLLWTTPRAQYELSSFAGQLRLLRVSHRAQPRWPHVASAPMAGEALVPRHLEGVLVATWSRRWGFGIERGTTPPPRKLTAPMQPCPYLLVRAPHWGVVGPSAVLPGAWGAMWAGRAWRQRRWARRGRCTDCGYDLRGVRGGRCPECGRHDILPPQQMGG